VGDGQLASDGRFELSHGPRAHERAQEGTLCRREWAHHAAVGDAAPVGSGCGSTGSSSTGSSSTLPCSPGSCSTLPCSPGSCSSASRRSSSRAAPAGALAHAGRGASGAGS
jgi:hypothetical protein